uniref:Putative trypsin-like serine protease n=2 Tax=Culex tarsalis TaxID=7177 RepID=A0A1Q3FQK6_CULTA
MHILIQDRQCPSSVSKKMLPFFVLSLLPLTVHCSVLTPPRNARIVGGVNVLQNDFPFAVSIHLVSRELSSCGSGYICTGTLISSWAVLTSARCVRNGSGVRVPEELKLLVGTKSRTNCSGAVELPVEEIRMHEGANLAVLRLKWAVTGVETAVLNEYQQVEGKQCLLVGWGANVTQSGPVEWLQEAYVRIVAQEKCSDGMICAKGEREHAGACYGDLGAPLLCDGSVAGVLGVDSKECGGQVSVFIGVRANYEWIRTQLSASSIVRVCNVLIILIFIKHVIS